MKDLKRLVKQFRDAIDVAWDAGEFDNDNPFYNFPQGCCGDACDLLAQFLLENGIRTHYVCGTFYEGTFENHQSHAWLLAENQLVLDITGDQFRDNSLLLNYDKPVYVGNVDDFHRLFEVEDRDVHENYGLDDLGDVCQPRLTALYKKIVKYIYK